jgi:hypothetical protein
MEGVEWATRSITPKKTLAIQAAAVFDSSHKMPTAPLHSSKMHAIGFILQHNTAEQLVYGYKNRKSKLTWPQIQKWHRTADSKPPLFHYVQLEHLLSLLCPPLMVGQYTFRKHSTNMVWKQMPLYLKRKCNRL